jgi:hypothetical protein
MGWPVTGVEEEVEIDMVREPTRECTQGPAACAARMRDGTPARQKHNHRERWRVVHLYPIWP